MQNQMEIEFPKIQELHQTHQRDINCIVDEDRNTRKRGLTNVLKGIFEKKHEPQVVIYLFQHNVCKNLMRGFEDKIEKNRELSFKIVEKLFDFIPGNEKQLDRDIVINLLRLFSARLNQIPFPEQSEEIRLQIIEILKKFLKHYPDEFLPVLQEVALCVSKALQDQFPNLKKCTSELIIQMSDSLSKHIGHHNTSIVKALGLNLKHQHSRVRRITLQAVTAILLTQSGGSALEHVQPLLKQIVFDHNNEVRKESLIGIGKLLTGFSIGNLKQFEVELVKLLLNGLSDEIPEIVQLTQDILEDVGLKRKQLAIELEENIDDFI